MELISLASKGTIFPTPGGGFYSPLSTALCFVLLHAGSHGLSVCQALKNLVKQGYSKLLNSDVHTRALQVKAALRNCPAFKEIEGKRFVLRFTKQNDYRISPIRLCKSKKVCGKKHGKFDKDFIMGDRQTTAIGRDQCVEGPCNQATVVQEKDMHMVGSCNQERSLHMKVPILDTPTANNVCTQSLDGKKHENFEGCCLLDGKHWGCIQHTSLGSLYSDRVNESGRGDFKDSAFILQGKDPGDVSCRSKDAHQEDKPQLGRCRRTDGKRWRCAKQVQLGSIYCEHHHIMRKGGYKAKVVDVVSEVTPPSIRSSEAFSGKCVIKEEEGICFEPLKLANESLYVSTAQGVASSCEISAKEELHKGQEETKLFLHTLELHNFEGVRRSKIKEKLAGLGKSVMVEATMHEGQKVRMPKPHALEEERHEGKEETKQYLHRLGLHDIEDVERLKKELNLTGHGQSVTVERTIHEGQQKTKPEKEVLEVQEKKGLYLHTVGLHDQLRSISSENRHLTWKRGTMIGADVASQLQSSVIPFKALLDNDVVKEEEDMLVEPSRLATGPLGGTVAQEVTSPYKISVKEEFHEVHKETRHCLPRLELFDLEGVQRSKKKPKLAGHGQSVMLDKHEGQEETKPDQHALEKVRYEIKQETTPKLHALEIHDLEDARRPNEAPRLAQHRQMIMLEKTVHEQQETAKPDTHVPASDGLDYMQRPHEDSMSRGQRSLMMLELKKGVSYDSCEAGTEMYKAKDLQIELSNPKEKIQIAAKMPWLFSENPNRRLMDLGASSLSGQASMLDRSLHVSNECVSPGVCTDAPRQCHRKDGKGWQCSRQCKPGYIYCEHHHGRLSRTSTNGKKKMILQLELDKQVLATCLKGNSETQVLRVAIDVPQPLKVKGLKSKVTHCTGVVGEGDARHEGQTFGASSIAKSTYRHIEERRNITGPRDPRCEGQTIPTIRLASFTGRPPEGITVVEDKDASQLGRCHRKDGKGWQCAQQSKHGSIYCDRHQRQRSKSLFPRSQHTLSFSRGPDFQGVEYVSGRCTYMQQPSHLSVHISNSGLEHALEPKLRQEVETRSCKQDDLGLVSLSLGTPVRALNGSCLWEANTTSEQAVSLKKCHRRDGKKWQCSRLCMPGYNHCEHHQGRGRKVKFKT